MNSKKYSIWFLTVSLVSAGTTVPVLADEETTLVYGSGDYTRINPAMDEHGEINILIFNGLTAHDGDNQVVPGLAESRQTEKRVISKDEAVKYLP